jgi:hypothetical protein
MNNELNIISEGIAIIILSVILFSFDKTFKTLETINELPKNFKKAMLMYMTGLIVLEKEASNKKMASILSTISHDSLTRMLNSVDLTQLISESRKTVGVIAIVFFNFCMSNTALGWLIIDDFLIPKRYGVKIEGVYNEYDHAGKERLKGMKIVLLIWTDGTIRVPISWAIWHKEKKIFLGLTKGKKTPKYKHTGKCLLEINGRPLPYKSKNELAMELTRELKEKGLAFEYITFDSWYASRNNIKALHQLGIKFYSRIKKNRNIIFNSEKMSMAQLDKTINNNSLNLKHNAYIKSLIVYLPGFGNIKLLIVRRDKHNEKGSTKFLFTNDLSIGATKLLLSYRSRWAIETIIRDLKQNLNIGFCQARSLKAQTTHIALSFITFAILETQPDFTFNSFSANTIGEKKQLLSSLLIIKSNNKIFILHNKIKSCLFSFESSCFARVGSLVNYVLEILNS